VTLPACSTDVRLVSHVTDDAGNFPLFAEHGGFTVCITPLINARARTPTHVYVYKLHPRRVVSLLHLGFFVQLENGTGLGTKLSVLSTKESACTTVK